MEKCNSVLSKLQVERGRIKWCWNSVLPTVINLLASQFQACVVPGPVGYKNNTYTLSLFIEFPYRYFYSHLSTGHAARASMESGFVPFDFSSKNQTVFWFFTHYVLKVTKKKYWTPLTYYNTYKSNKH